MNDRSVSSIGLFAQGRDRWLERQDDLDEVLRREATLRQLEVHLPLAPATVLDVGAGQGWLTLALARQGYTVTAIEPDPVLRRRLETALAADTDLAARVRVLDEEVETLDEVFAPAELFDVVICHGVLPYVPDPNPVIRALGRRVVEDGILSVVAGNPAGGVWGDVLAGDADAVLARLAETDRAGWEKRDVRYTDEHGLPARADTIERLGAFFGGSRVGVEYWYGIGCTGAAARRDADDPRRAPTREQVEAEFALSRVDPYRRMGTGIHVVGRRGAGRGPQITW